jgi:hypothetical protein
MNKEDKCNIINKTSDCEGVVKKGKNHLLSFVSRIQKSALHKWDDYFGSLHVSDRKKHCFGLFIFLTHEIMHNSNVEEALKMYSTLGSAINHGHDNYLDVKERFLNGDVLCKRKDEVKLIQPAAARDKVAMVASTMMSGFKEATKHFTNNSDFTDNFCKVHGVLKEKMLSVVRGFVGKNTIDFQQPLLGEYETTFLEEADLFWGKFVWMALQHIQSFPHMQGSDEYINKQMQNKSPQVSSGNNKSNDN